MQDDQPIEKKVFETFLDEPFEVKVAIKDLTLKQRIGLRMWKRKEKAVFSLTGVTLGNLYKISSIILDVPDPLKVKGTEMDAGFLMMKDSKTLAKILAIAFHNKKSNPPDWLTDFFLCNLDAEDLKTLSEIVVTKLKIMDFISTIVIWKVTSLMKPREIIAHGELSAASSDTSDTNETTSSGE